MICLYFIFWQLFDENRFNDHQHIWPLNLNTSSNVTIRKGLITNRQKNLVLSKFCQCELSLRRYFWKTKFRFCRWERERGCSRSIVSCNIWKILRVWVFKTPRDLSFSGVWGFREVLVFETAGGGSEFFSDWGLSFRNTREESSLRCMWHAQTVGFC